MKQSHYIGLFVALSSVYLSGCAVSDDAVAQPLNPELQSRIDAERAGHLRQTHVRFMSLDDDEDGYISLEEFNRSGNRAFELMDTNKDGVLSKDDPAPERRRRGEDTRSEEQKAADAVSAGARSRDEIGQNRPQNRPESLLKMPTTHSFAGLLDMYDQNKDGVVSREEYDTARKQQFERIDKNGDGRLSYDEYVAEYAERLDKRIAETVKALKTK